MVIEKICKNCCHYYVTVPNVNMNQFILCGLNHEDLKNGNGILINNKDTCEKWESQEECFAKWFKLFYVKCRECKGSGKLVGNESGMIYECWKCGGMGYRKRINKG